MKNEPNGVQLSGEDRVRMTRLYEEVASRLEEMGFIVGRKLQMDLSSKVVKFSPAPRSAKGGPGAKGGAKAKRKVRVMKGTTIVCTSKGCGCYDNDTGICYAC